VLVGYYASWARATMPPNSVPWSELTHVAHAFVLPSSSGGLTSIATYVDAELVAQAHAHGVKVVAVVGGAGVSFDALIDPTARAATVRDLASLCATYGYDGIDVDWEFPDATTVDAWTSLLTELRTALDAVHPGLSISAAISAGDAGDVLPVAALNALTWIGVMTYDYAGDWSATTGHVAPLYASSGGDGGSVSQSIQHLVARGVAPSKMLLGLPFYGAEFGAMAIASTPISPFTSIDYRDVVAMPASDGWTTQWDATAQVPYRVRSASPGFLSYDDATSIAAKCTFEKSSGLGGAMIWHLAGDRLADGTNPLLAAAQACR
jgi:chitinase